MDSSGITSLLGGAGGAGSPSLVGGLLGASNNQQIQLSAMQNLLSSAYNINQPASVVDLSEGLEAFISQLDDQNTSAKLLADLSAINKIAPSSEFAGSYASLLSPNDSGSSSGLLNLLT